jgi:hypothetical protein
MLLLNGYFNPKERLVVKLRKEGKNYRQIAEEARISPRDIKSILVKYRVDDVSGYTDNDGNADPDSLMSISSKAYKLFSEEMMTPQEVAIALNLEAPEAMRYHDEFLELNGRGSLAKLFKEIGNEGISWLLHLCAVAKSNRRSINEIIECVSIYGEDLPMIKQLREDANSELQALLRQTYQSEIGLDFLNSKLEKLDKDFGSKQIECEKVDKEKRKLVGQALRLRGFVSEFKNNNRTYRRIEQFVEDTVDQILRKEDNMKLLEFALISVLKSLPGSDQYKYRYLLHKLDLVEVSGSFDTSITSVATTANTIPRIESNTIVVRNNNSISYSKAPNQHHHSYLTSKNDHCPACFEREILAMSKMYFEMLRKQMTDEIMTTISKENLSGF